MDMNGKLKGADDHMIWSETDTETIFKDEQYNKVSTASQHNISLLLQEI